MGRITMVSRWAFALGAVAVVVLSLLPGREMPSLAVSDKVEHMIAYASLGLAGGLAFPTRRGALLLLVLLPLMGIALEIAQLMVPGRSSEVADAFADLVGVAATLLPVLLFRFSASRTR